MSWVDSPEIGDGRSSIWLTNAVPLYFKFNGSRVPKIDRVWIQRLDSSATAPTGLIVTDADGTALRAGPIDLSRGQPNPSVYSAGR